MCQEGMMKVPLDGGAVNLESRGGWQGQEAE